jgi:hypothetical protein
MITSLKTFRIFTKVMKSVNVSSQLVPGDVQSLMCQVQRIHVVSGQAWITVDGQDFVLKSGQELSIPKCHYPAVISSMGRRPLVYRVVDSELSVVLHTNAI